MEVSEMNKWRGLNLGCGKFPKKGWLNVDIREGEGVDLVMDLNDGDNVMSLLEHGPFRRVYMGHVLEHLDIGIARRLVQFIVGPLMEPEARVMIVGPDLRRAVNRFDQTVIDGVLHGPSDDDPHLWTCTEEALWLMLACCSEIGGIEALDVKQIDHREWPLVSKIGWQCAVMGYRGETLAYPGL